MTIKVRHKKQYNHSKDSETFEIIEEWAAYWRSNPHRFATDYCGFTLYDFQQVLFYAMFKFAHFIFVASRGLKSWPNSQK